MEKAIIREFRGRYTMFSNFSPGRIKWMGRVYISVEQPFQASKHPQPESVDHDLHERLGREEAAMLLRQVRQATGGDFRQMPILDIFTALPPGKAKKLGHRIPKRPDWESSARTCIMYALLLQKFSTGTPRETLLHTAGAHIEEGNTWNDTTWGICPPGSGNGENLLGRLLMGIARQMLQGTLPQYPTTIEGALACNMADTVRQILAN